MLLMLASGLADAAARFTVAFAADSRDNRLRHDVRLGRVPNLLACRLDLALESSAENATADLRPPLDRPNFLESLLGVDRLAEHENRDRG
jgi:hypothetical protein